MKTTMTLSQSLSIDFFKILDREIDDVVLLINFYLMLGNEKKPNEKVKNKVENNYGFWDF